MNDVECDRCFRQCSIPPGKDGACHNVGNRDGRIKLLTYGRVSTVSVGPVEHKGIFHCPPGMKTFSMGGNGCNLTCKFCQNHKISQVSMGEEGGRRLEPGMAICRALEEEAGAVALTFSEPLMFFEYAVDVFDEARAAGLRTILKTNGMCNPWLFAALLDRTDHVNVDLKGDETFYESVCGAGREAFAQLRENLDIAAQMSSLEVTCLIPYHWGRASRAKGALGRLVGRRVPVHLVGVLPDYRMKDAVPPPREAMEESRETVSQMGFEHVYVHCPGAGNKTRCEKCSSILIEREGTIPLVARMNDNRCHCGHELWRGSPCDTITNAGLAGFSS
jgi:pyruvate formate lyase activating enzyme